MSKLQELIDHLCPNGVEFKPLGEIVSIVVAPKKFNKKEYQETGLYPIIDQGKSLIIGFTNDSSSLLPPKEYVLFGEHTRHVKYYNGSFAQGADGLKILLAKEIILPKYLFFAMECLIIEDRGYNRHWTVVSPMLIPIPPLEVQDEIVKILDRFADYAAELQAELQARKEQYEYYRNLLLTFNTSAYGCGTDDAQKISVIARGGHSYKIQWKTMGEIFEMRNGYTPSKNKPEFWENGTIPWFRMEDIRENGRILADSIQHITPASIKGKGLFEANTFILATTATIGEHALLIADSLANQQFTNLKVRKSLANLLDTKFIFYYMFIVDEFCKNNTNVSGFASVDMGKLKQMPFPIPPLELQEKIVAILDRFETLVNDLSKGLPAEIEAVKARYEYYRNKLLTFKQLSA